MWSVRSDAEPAWAKWVILCCKKNSSEPCAARTQTDSGDQVENYQGDRDTMVKELGKMPRNYSEKGDRPSTHQLGAAVRVAETRPKRLFTKNTGPCEVARRSIRTDSCPVLEG